MLNLIYKIKGINLIRGWGKGRARMEGHRDLVSFHVVVWRLPRHCWAQFQSKTRENFYRTTRGRRIGQSDLFAFPLPLPHTLQIFHFEQNQPKRNQNPAHCTLQKRQIWRKEGAKNNSNNRKKKKKKSFAWTNHSSLMTSNSLPPFFFSL